MLGLVIIGVSESAKVQELRLDQADGSIKRMDEWVEFQTNRANWLAVTIIVTILLALALYIANHIRVVNESPPLRWQTHLTANEYITQPDDSLLAAAAALDTDVAQLALANPTIVLQTQLTRTSTMVNGLQLQPTGPDGRSLDAIARDLRVTPEEVALGFATVELQPTQVLRIPNSGPRLWIDWILWGVVGVGTYLLIQAAQYYRKIPEGKGDFINETPWYLTQLLTGPLIAFVVLALLTQIDFSILGQTEETAISVNLNQLPYDAMFGIAFLLGFFSRVTRKLLGLITQSLFRPAWSAAAGTFDILIKGDPNATRIESEGRVVFTTEPFLSDLEWKVSEGELDGATYRAPKAEEQTHEVVVTALVNDGSHRKVARTFDIVPHKYEIEVDGDAVIGVGETHLHFVSNTEPLTEKEKKEIYWHWRNKQTLQMVFRLPNATDSESSGVDSDSCYGSDVDIIVKTPPDERQEVDIVASYRGHATTKHLIVAESSLDDIETFLLPNGQSDDVVRLDTPVTVTPRARIKFRAIGNLAADDEKTVTWTVKPENANLNFPAAIGPTMEWEVPESLDQGEVILVARVPDSPLEKQLALTIKSSN